MDKEWNEWLQAAGGAAFSRHVPIFSLFHVDLQGIGIEEILEAVVERIPPPKDARSEPLRALIFDSYYDAYKVGLPHVLFIECHRLPGLSWQEWLC